MHKCFFYCTEAVRIRPSNVLTVIWLLKLKRIKPAGCKPLWLTGRSWAAETKYQKRRPAVPQTQMWDDGGIFVASTGLLPDYLFVCLPPPFYRMSAISDAARSAQTKSGEGWKYSGEMLTIHFKHMQDAVLESMCKIKYTRRPDMSQGERWKIKTPKQVCHSAKQICPQFGKTFITFIGFYLYTEIGRLGGSKWLFTDNLNLSQFKITDSSFPIRHQRLFESSFWIFHCPYLHSLRQMA